MKGTPGMRTWYLLSVNNTIAEIHYAELKALMLAGACPTITISEHN